MECELKVCQAGSFKRKSKYFIPIVEKNAMCEAWNVTQSNISIRV